MPLPPPIFRLGLAAHLLAASAASFAQAIPDAGRLLEETRPVPALPPRETPPLQVEEAPAKPAPEGMRIAVNRLRITGATRFSEAELHALVADGEGRELSLNDLQALAARITRHYREHGYLLARAYLPAQDVQDGEVEIALLEGRLGEVEIRNSAEIGGAALSPLAALQPGEIASESRLERNLLLLSDLPGVEVRSTLKPGAAVGASDLLVEVAPGPRLAGSADFDTCGDRYSGQARLGGTVNFNNPFRSGDQASVRIQGSEEGMGYLRFSYQLPINSLGTRAGFSGSIMHYQLGKTLAPLGAKGESQVRSLYLQHPFARSRRFNLYGQLQYDRLHLEDRITSADTLVEKALENWSIGLAGDIQDGFGGEAANTFALTYTSGKLGLDPDSRDLDEVTARTAGSFVKWNLSWLRLQRLSDAASLYFAASAQFAGKNLDSSQKLSLGGANGVRAYPQGEAPGDETCLLTLEARYRLALPLPGLWQATAFIDHGEARINKSPWEESDNHRRLTGAGIGLQAALAPDWAMKASLAWRGASEKPTSDADRSPRGWVQVVKYF